MSMDNTEIPYIANKEFYSLLGFNFPIIIMLVFIFVILSENELTTEYGINLVIYIGGFFTLYLVIFICESLTSTKETQGGIISRTNNLCNVFNSRGILSLKSGIFNKSFAYVTYTIIIIMHSFSAHFVQNTFSTNLVLNIITLCLSYFAYIYILFKDNCMNLTALSSSMFVGLFVGLLMCMFLYEMNTKTESCDIV